jgi:hypothetical protein
MEVKEIKNWLKKHKKPVMCVRFLAIYLILFIVKHSPIFDTGLNPKHVISVLMIGIIVLYRFLSIAFVPAILILWISEILSESHTFKESSR